MILYNERNISLENQNQNKNQKLFLLILFFLLTICPILPVINKLFPKENIYENNHNNIKIRDTLEEENKNSLLFDLNDLLFEGTWKDEQNNNGMAFIHFSTNHKLYPNKLNINSRLMHGSTIANWIIIYSTIYIQNISIEKNNINNLIINAKSSNLVEKGKMFKKDNYYTIDSSIELNITKLNSSIIKINGIIHINGGVIFFNLNNSKDSDKIYEKKIKIYTIFLSILLILVFIINQITIKNVNNSISNAKSISILSLYINLIWSGYGCFFHFYLILTNNQGFKYFSFIGALFFINFSLTDYRFLDIILKINNKHFLNDFEIFKKRIVRFYLMSYLILFFMLIFMIDFIFNEYLSILYIILTWLPQIIYNCYYYNRTSLPYIYIIINSIFRLFPSFYFFFFQNNFMFIPQKKYIAYLNLFIMISLIIFMQLQIHIGPKFFLPNKYNINNNSLYKTKMELLNKFKNIPYECSICLGPLLEPILDNEKELKNKNDIIKISSKEISKENSSVNETNKNYISQKVDIKEYDNNNIKTNKEYYIIKNVFSFKNIIKNIILFFIKSFNFFTISNNKYNKEYIITPCNHIFHSNCLEKWFEKKKECPFCRNEFDNLI